MAGKHHLLHQGEQMHSIHYFPKLHKTRTGWKLLGAEEEEDVTLEEVGATFGFVKEDVLLVVQDRNQSQIMEVVMSPPMIQVGSSNNILVVLLLKVRHVSCEIYQSRHC